MGQYVNGLVQCRTVSLFSIIPKKIFIRRSTESGISIIVAEKATHSQSVSAITGKIVSILSPSKGNRVNKSRSFTNGMAATQDLALGLSHRLVYLSLPVQGRSSISMFLLLQPLLLRHIRPEMWLPLLPAFWLFL